MITTSTTRWAALCLLAAALLLTGCAGEIKNMQSYTGDPAALVPAPDKAMIVFLRPSTLGFGVQSSVFHVGDSELELAGIVAAKMKTAYQVDPGSHLFMVIGESADFMSAELEAGKTYHALVTPRMGAWKARFSLRPVPKAGEDRAKLDQWLSECQWVEQNAASEAWARENMASIKEKQAKYYPAWMEKDEASRPKLNPGDGM
jgi:hypothetical protein